MIMPHAQLYGMINQREQGRSDILVWYLKQYNKRDFSKNVHLFQRDTIFLASDLQKWRLNCTLNFHGILPRNKSQDQSIMHFCAMGSRTLMFEVKVLTLSSLPYFTQTSVVISHKSTACPMFAHKNVFWAFLRGRPASVLLHAHTMSYMYRLCRHDTV